MKNFKMTAIAAIAILSACANLDDTYRMPASISEEKCSFTVSVHERGEHGTKASSKATGETSVNTLQVFVFRPDGSLDAYGCDTKDSIKVSCSLGSRKIYALANAPSLTNISSENTLLSTVTNLSNNSASNFEMIGSLTSDLSSSTTSLDIEISRIAARIVVKSIKNKMTSPYYQSQTFKIKSIYLTNVAGDNTYKLDAAPTNYYHKMAYTATSGIDALTFETLNDASIAYNGSHNTAHYFYTYPNPSADVTEGGSWSPRCTRLVIKAELGGTTYYYPINLPTPLEKNKSYEISDIIISRPGSTDEDKPVSFTDCTFSVTVSGWTTQNIDAINI